MCLCVWCHVPASVVLQASGEALVSCAKFLKWKELKQQVRQKNTVGIMKCLVRTISQPPPFCWGKGDAGGGVAAAAVAALQAPCSCALLQLQQDRKGVEGHLQQSLPYLEDSQASLRCEAVRFIGEPNPCVPLWALPWQEGTALKPPGTACPCR